MSDDDNTEGEGEGAGASDDWGDALEEQATSEAVELDELESTGSPVNESEILNHPSIDVIMEIPVNISMQVGETKITIRNLLKLSQGSVVELDRFAGDPLDVFVNGNLIAHGEVVVVNEKFGIRLTDIISQAERIDKLGEPE